MAVAGDGSALSKIPFSLDDMSTPKKQNKNSLKNDDSTYLLWSNPERGRGLRKICKLKWTTLALLSIYLDWLKEVSKVGKIYFEPVKTIGGFTRKWYIWCLYNLH